MNLMDYNICAFILMFILTINSLMTASENITVNIVVNNIHDGQYCPATNYSVYVIKETLLQNLQDDLVQGGIGGDDGQLTLNEPLKGVKSLRINLRLFSSAKHIVDKNLLLYNYTTPLRTGRKHNVTISLEDECKNLNSPANEAKTTLVATIGSPRTMNCTSHNDKTNHTWCISYDKVTEGCIYYRTFQLDRSQTVYINFTAEAFDNNTIATCHHIEPPLNINKIYNIRVKGKSENDIATLSYNSSEPVRFGCDAVKLTRKRKIVWYVGEVNTSTILRKHKNSSILKTFGEADNGTMLCCLYYFEERNYENNIIITRKVKKKTLLIYIETDDGEDSKEVYIIYIAVGVGLVVTLVTLLLIVLKVKKLQNKTRPRELELDVYATLNRVEYAEIQGLRENAAPLSFSNDSPYAKIIGIIKPS